MCVCVRASYPGDEERADVEAEDSEGDEEHQHKGGKVQHVARLPEDGLYILLLVSK